MRREYRFDYGSARPNRFAEEFRGRTAVVLDADVAAVFGSSKSVNQLLRSVISALPDRVKAPRSRRWRWPAHSTPPSSGRLEFD